jgi:dTDP-4-amino-4,6-dideoxygalactose transaminase
VIEDAAQGIMATYKGRALGSIGHLGAYSFHETKNIISGEGGALLINDPQFVERAEIIREKGTDRSKFFKGQVDKYSWVDIGSSFLPSEITAAVLLAQFEEAESITNKRLAIWETYHQAFANLELDNKLRRPIIPQECSHNAHMYYLILPNGNLRDNFIAELNKHNILSVFHYIPLHNSIAGKKYGRTNNNLKVTEELSTKLVRLPFWLGLDSHQDEITRRIIDFLT